MPVGNNNMHSVDMVVSYYGRMSCVEVEGGGEGAPITIR